MRLALDGIAKSYGGTVVLRPTTLAVEDGEFLTVLGPSGSGKTTILRLIGGFAAASAGRILLDGRDITRLPAHLRPFNTVFQDYALFPHMTVAENVGYALMVRRRPKAEIRAKVSEALEIVGLSGLTGRHPEALSGGQRQRVALARALVCEPRVLLLDEPLSALDADMRRQMQLFLKRLQRRVKTTFVFVTHDQEEAITMSDRIVVMNRGRIEQVGTPKEVYYAPRTAFVSGFFGDNNLIDGVATAGGAVETPLGPLPTGAACPTPGSRVRLALRPEKIEVAREVPAGRLGWPGRIEEMTFVGAMTHLWVAPDPAPGLRLLVKLASGRETLALEPGAAVAVAFDPADLALLPLGDEP
ncbi:MAG TPA: ABC transporter ATP-binding protein [Dongiaceae bacterium]|nr:ABC transporter ATP-binding protein [Dongiaceae bacterium]